MLELFDPEVEVFVAPPNFESGTYRGHEEYGALLERWGASGTRCVWSRAD